MNGLISVFISSDRKALTCTLHPVTNPARGTAALEAACCIGARGMSVAVVGANLTFVDI